MTDLPGSLHAIHPPEIHFPHVHLPQGFSFSAVAAGIKVSGRPDLALAVACPGTTAAAVFTKNRVIAAPLEVDRAALKATRGRVRAVLVNSGNANCATGAAGLKACREVCSKTADLLGLKPQEIFPSSTGIIGVPLPAEKIIAKLPELIGTNAATENAMTRFARAIMTTDLRMKTASSRFRAGKSEITLTGIAKGSGMIHPQMATMLVYLFTDIQAPASDLQSLLRKTCDETFNCISVDGDTSTNDTVLLMASGQSGASLKKARKKFASALLEVCQSLAGQIVADGEGVKHVIRLSIQQAKNHAEALRIAKAIAHSLLVKTAWAGADPNWGRILAAMGACGVPIQPDHLEISIGDQIVFHKGTVNAFDETRAHQHLSQPVCDITIKLKRGKSSILFHTTDLTAEYVRINADYST
jgi:glutamate N-acetyltransferase/amino-acid N-acetyltransferase